MFEVEYRLNGRKVTANQLGDALQQQAVAAAADEVKRKVSTMLCREHSRAAKIVVNSSPRSEARLTVEGCCDEFIGQVTRALS